jgi:diguanylate cyclase (GGDEF)-like protein/PAS domain S-box-containing protein
MSPGVLAVLPEPALELDAAGRVVAANDLAAGLLGRRADGPAGLAGTLLPALAAPLAEVLAAGDERPLRRKLEGRRTDGTPFLLEVALRRSGDRVLCLLRELDDVQVAGEARRHFDAAFDTAPIGMAIFNTDGRYVRVNAALCAMLDRPAADLLGRRDQELTHPDDRAKDLDVAWDVLEGRRSTFQTEKRFLRPDGSVVWTIANLSFLRDEAGRPLSWVGQFQDITGRREAADALRRERDLSAAILSAMSDGYVLTHDGRIVAVNEALCRLTGFSEDELVGARVPFPFWPVDRRAETMAARDRVLAGGGGEEEVVLERKDGSRFHAATTSARVDGPDGALLGFVTTIRDVSERRRQEAELARQAYVDGLTGVLRRDVFLEQLRAAAERAGGGPLTLALLDLDRFKAINDTHGHPAGDRVLARTAEVLRAVSRDGDVLGRVGGEEFAWLLAGSDAEAALVAAERARRAVEATDFGAVGGVTLSAGLCELAQAGDVDELYRLADVALYAAKAGGRNRCVRHAPRG